MVVMNLIESLFRWIHVVAGIIWIGHLYFFNWVNSAVRTDARRRGQEEGDSRASPRALYLVSLGRCIHLGDGSASADDGLLPWRGSCGPESGAIAMILVTFLAVFLYDYLTRVITDAQIAISGLA